MVKNGESVETVKNEFDKLTTSAKYYLEVYSLALPFSECKSMEMVNLLYSVYKELFERNNYPIQPITEMDIPLNFLEDILKEKYLTEEERFTKVFSGCCGINNFKMFEKRVKYFVNESNVNITIPQYGKPLLHYCAGVSWKLFEHLLSLGADPTIRVDEDKDVFDILDTESDNYYPQRTYNLDRCRSVLMRWLWKRTHSSTV